MTVSISSMRKARSDCSVTLNLAVSPSTWLLQSDMVILNERIPRYNNTLLRVSENGMKFGVNHELNYDKSHAVQEKVHQATIRWHNLNKSLKKRGYLLRDQ